MRDLHTERRRRWSLLLGGMRERDQHESFENQIDSCLDAAFPSIREAGQGESSLWCPIPEEFPKLFPKETEDWLIRHVNLRRHADKWIKVEQIQSTESNLALLERLLQLRHHVREDQKIHIRMMVRQLVVNMLKQITPNIQQAVTRGGNRYNLQRQRCLAKIDWSATIHTNLKHYLPERRWLIPEEIKYKQSQNKGYEHIIIALDQSGSMAGSVIYLALIGSILASLPSLRTSLIAYDTEVVDLSHVCKSDPVDLLYGVHLGGGNDTPRALDYCSKLIDRTVRTVFFLVSDLVEGALSDAMFQRLIMLRDSGAQVFIVAARDDNGKLATDPLNLNRAKELLLQVITPDVVESVLSGSSYLDHL